MIGHAIVLKNYLPKKNKVTILHEHVGKVTIFVDEKKDAARLCNGSLLYCQIIKKKSSYQYDFVDAYFIPRYDLDHDLYFIHDILKICLQFMPDQVAMRDVFHLIMDMYKQLDTLQACQKKIYLLKLFLYLGIFPDNKNLYQHIMQHSDAHNHDTDALLQQGLWYCWNTDINYS